MEKDSSVSARAAKYAKAAIGFVFLFVISLAGTAQTKWNVTKSSVTFKIKNAGITVNGSLDSLTANIQFDELNYYMSSIQANVRTNTINTDNKMRDNHLRKPEYFDAAAHPTINMKSTMFAHNADGTYKGNFKLTIKGITKDVVVPFTYMQTVSNATFKGSFTINRRDYNVGGGSLILGDDVIVTLVIDATK